MRKLYAPGDVVEAPVKEAIEEIPLAPPPVPKLSQVQYFSQSKDIRESLELDATPFCPSKVVSVSGQRFAQAYLRQLEAMLYNKEENLDHRTLTSITTIYEAVTSRKRPIRLMSQAFRKKLPTICGILNRFFQENELVIASIAKQLD